MFDLIDLTHPLNEKIPSWSGKQEFKKETTSDYPHPRVCSLECTAGIGTHMDAPSHFIKGGRSIDTFQLKELFAPLCILDVRDKMKDNLFISLEDIHAYEKKYGKIPPHSVLCGLTGWDKKWNHPQAYRNDLNFPGFSKLVGPLCLERNIAGLGIDTLSPDGSDHNFPIHYLLLGAGKFLLENLTNLEKLPPHGAYILLAPLLIEEASESPIRAIGCLMK